MNSKKTPVTPAVRVLRTHKIPFREHWFAYQEKSGARHAARLLGVTEHGIVKTLVMENDQRQPFIVLMHGDRQVSTKQLARALGVKSITPSPPDTANRYSGYRLGGTSPFGTRHSLPVFIEASILALPVIYVNGGRRGYMLEMRSADLQRILQATPVRVAVPGERRT